MLLRCVLRNAVWHLMVIACVVCWPRAGNVAQDQPAAGDPAATPSAAETCLPVPIEKHAPPGNSGLFIGINRFDDMSLPPLRFAVHDAIEQAYLFVVELKLIPPENCVVALRGEPSAQSVEEHLHALRGLKVQVIAADLNATLDSLEKVVAQPDREGALMIVSISSHGLDGNGIAYVMPSDGRKDRLERTALSLQELEAKMAKAVRVSHRLLLVDACQQRILDNGKRGSTSPPVVGMSDAFASALEKTSGQGKFAACSLGQASYESYLLGNAGHGVFTFALLEALRGGAEPDENNLIRLHTVISFVNRRVTDWANYQNLLRNPEGPRVEQSPSWYGPEKLREMPLAQRGDETDVLIAKLRNQVDGGEFSKEQCEQVVAWLKSNDLSSTHNREFFLDVRRFAVGEIQARIFVPYITQKLIGKPVRLQGDISSQVAQRERDAWVETQHLSGTLQNSIGMQFVLIPNGEFLMGSELEDKGRDQDEYRHPVRLTRPYYLAVCETTQAVYEQVMNSNPSYFSPTGTGRDKVAKEDTSQFPVETVSWSDAVAFCQRLSALDEEQRAGRTYRLPTEAEWEFACLANGTGDDGLALAKQACYRNKDNTPEYPRCVGTLAANGFGLYDMLGNVSEWCQDWYDPEYYRVSPVNDPVGPEQSDSARKVIRGGSWIAIERMCRASFRNRDYPDNRNNTGGFRVVLEAATGS